MHTHAKTLCQRSLGSKDEVDTGNRRSDGRTNRHTEPIALPASLTRSVRIYSVLRFKKRSHVYGPSISDFYVTLRVKECLYQTSLLKIGEIPPISSNNPAEVLFCSFTPMGLQLHCPCTRLKTSQFTICACITRIYLAVFNFYMFKRLRYAEIVQETIAIAEGPHDAHAS